MKKLLLVLCIFSSTQTVRAMEGMVCCAIVPALAGLYYIATSKQPVDKKVGQLALMTGGGAAAGGVSHLLLHTVLPATIAGTATGLTAGAFGCGVVAFSILANAGPIFRK